MLIRPVYRLHRRQWVPLAIGRAFAFFERPENLALITPPWLGFTILTPIPVSMQRGLAIDYRVRPMGVATRWRSRITEYDPPFGFRDEQEIGPYRRWDHRHRFREQEGGTVIEDLVLYEPPFGPIGALVNRLAIRPRLERIFDYRREQIGRRLGRPHVPAREADGAGDRG